MTSFTSRLRTAALAAAVAGLAGCATPDDGKNNLGMPTVPLTIDNQASGHGDLYVYIAGATGSGTWYYVSDRDGDVTPFAANQPPLSYGINLGTAPTATLRLPQLVGMRVYVSFAKPLQVGTSAAAVPGSPAGWVPSDANYNTLFDWAELTWVPGPDTATVLGGNVTEVDMFGLATRLQLTGYQSDRKTPLTVESGFPDGARAKILGALTQAGDPWSNLVVKSASGMAVRALAPYHGMELGVFPKDQLDGYIADVYSVYKSRPLKATAEGVTFVGSTQSGSLVFEPSAGGGEAIIFPRPTSFSVYTSGPLPTKAGPKPGVIQAALQGAFLRGTLLTNPDVDDCQPAQFYVNPPVNVYAKAIHAHSLNGLAYAFGFDDTCSQSSYISVFNPTGLSLTIPKF